MKDALVVVGADSFGQAVARRVGADSDYLIDEGVMAPYRFGDHALEAAQA